MIYLILGIINLLLIALLVYEYWKQKKKQHFAVILDKNGEVVEYIKINPSYKNFTHSYKDKKYSYLLPDGLSFIKFKNYRLYLYEFNKPEPLNPIKDGYSIMMADLFDELLEMNKIKALNEAKKGLFDKIDKKYLFAGAVVVILIIIFFNGGV